jgi:type IV secretion system protein TrbG
MRRTLLMAGLGFLLSSGAFAQEIPAIQQTPPLRPIPPMGPGQTITLNGTSGGVNAGQVPRAMTPKVPVLSPENPITRKEREGLRAAGQWRTRSAIPSLGGGGIVYFQYGQGEPVIVCAPLRVCDIALEPGETVTSPPYLADHRWTAEPGTSGSGNAKVTHVIVKPSDVGLTTNMIVQTDRRTYSFQLTSRAKEYMPLVAFDYPADKTKAAWADYTAQMQQQATPLSPCDQPPTTPPSNYRISGDDAPFRPVQVYAVSTPVGQKTCVEMPADIGSHNLPALLAVIEEGSWFSDPTRQMVNMRFVNHRFVVDGLLTHFELVDGVGSSQRVVNVKSVGGR